jgi:hypothetical protein
MVACQYGVYSKRTKSEKNERKAKARKNPVPDETGKREPSVKTGRKFNPTKVEKAAATSNSEYPTDVMERIPPTDQNFVLTHHDLAPRNLMVDLNGKLWLLDWEYTGFIPYILSMRQCRILTFLKLGVGLIDFDARYSAGSPWILTCHFSASS